MDDIDLASRWARSSSWTAKRFQQVKYAATASVRARRRLLKFSRVYCHFTMAGITSLASWNVAGVLRNPKNICFYQNSLLWVTKAIISFGVLDHVYSPRTSDNVEHWKRLLRHRRWQWMFSLARQDSYQRQWRQSVSGNRHRIEGIRSSFAQTWSVRTILDWTAIFPFWTAFYWLPSFLIFNVTCQQDTDSDVSKYCHARPDQSDTWRSLLRQGSHHTSC